MINRCILTVAAGLLMSVAFAEDPAPQPSRPPIVLAGNLGLTFVDGPTDTQTYNFLLSADRVKKGVDAMHLDGGYFFSRQTTATSNQYNVASNFSFINGRYDKTVSGRIAAYGSLGYRVDTPNDLKLRSLYGAGAAYDIHDGKNWNWSVSTGYAYLIENYVSGASSSYQQSAAFGSQYTRSAGQWTVSHSLSVIPALSKFSNYIATSVLSLGYQISKPVKLTVNNVVDYASEPAPGSLKKNSQWFVGLSFGGSL